MQTALFARTSAFRSTLPACGGPDIYVLPSTVTYVGTSTSMTAPSGMQEDDFCFLVAYSTNSGTFNTPTGYTAVYSGYNAAPGVNYGLWYKLQGATPDTTISNIGGVTGNGFIAFAVRNVDTTTPLDVTPTSASNSNSGNPDAPSITTVTDRALVLSVGYEDNDLVASVTPPTGYSLIKHVANSGYGYAAASWKFLATAGAEDPGSYSSVANDGWVAYSVALRPANGGVAPCVTDWAFPTETAGNVDGGDVAWTSTANITADDTSWAAVTMAKNEASYGLRGSNYGFSVPSGATIEGVEMEFEADVDTSGACTVGTIKMYVNGAYSGDDMSNGEDPTTAGATYTIGGGADTWGVSLTPALVNASNFGCYIKAVRNSTSGNYTFYVNYIKMRIWYST